MHVKIQKIKYNLSPIDKLRIQAIKAKLFMKRIERGKRFIGTNGLIIFFVLTIIWLLFSLMQMILEPCVENDNISFAESFWQIRREYISTVIIVMAIDACNKAIDNRKKLKKQHLLYYELISTAGTLFEPFIGEMVLHMMPFYNEKMYFETYEYIKDKSGGKIAIKLKEFEKPFNDLVQLLFAFSNDIKSGNLVIKSEETLLSQIDETISTLITFEDRIREKEDPVALFEELTASLYSIIDDIRLIWRLDVSDRKKIIGILYRRNKEAIEEDFYKRMFICSVQDIERIVKRDFFM